MLPADVSFEDEEPFELALGALAIDDVASPDEGAVSFADLPEQVDLHATMPAVRNQGSRGTCVSPRQVGRAGVPDRRRQHQRQSLRAVSLLGVQTSAMVTLPMAARGSRLLWACCRTQASARRPIWPYNKAVVANNEGGPPPANAQAQAASFKVISTKQLQARWLQDLKGALADGQPVAFSVSIFQSWQNPWTYRNGDIRLPLPGERNLGGHAMCMVGYADDDDVPGGGYFIVRNSWGEAFGQQGKIAPGYCRLPLCLRPAKRLGGVSGASVVALWFGAVGCAGAGCRPRRTAWRCDLARSKQCVCACTRLVARR